MTARPWRATLVAAIIALLAALAYQDVRQASPPVPADRREVVFWHFWGGRDRAVVEEIVRRFNASQHVHFVRAVAMPGSNLDVKFFLALAGGDPPDVLNQDDPVVADWASRGALLPLDQLATHAEFARLREWLFPAAQAIGRYQGKLYALCNGLDIRALYYNADVLDSFGLRPPQTLDELDRAARRISPPHQSGPVRRYGYLPDPRRIWAWGIVFGGQFYDDATGRVTADSEPIVRALEWMASYIRLYGAEQVVRFRNADQALPGAAFPLLEGRYAMIMDGQWRVAEVDAVAAAARAAGKRSTNFGVEPLPPPPGGRTNAGWVNGNFFIVPRQAHNSQGAWEFMKFWSGFGGHEREAARACAAGGWIPASQRVVDEPAFQKYLERHPLMQTFIDLAGSPNQVPTPSLPGASFFQDEVIRAAEDAMYKLVPAREALKRATDRVRARLEANAASADHVRARLEATDAAR